MMFFVGQKRNFSQSIVSDDSSKKIKTDNIIATEDEIPMLSLEEQQMKKKHIYQYAKEHPQIPSKYVESLVDLLSVGYQQPDEDDDGTFFYNLLPSMFQKLHPRVYFHPHMVLPSTLVGNGLCTCGTKNLLSSCWFSSLSILLPLPNPCFLLVVLCLTFIF